VLFSVPTTPLPFWLLGVRLELLLAEVDLLRFWGRFAALALALDPLLLARDPLRPRVAAVAFEREEPLREAPVPEREDPLALVLEPELFDDLPLLCPLREADLPVAIWTLFPRGGRTVASVRVPAEAEKKPHEQGFAVP